MSNGPVAADELRLLIERIERLEEEKKGIADDIKDVYNEAKSRGFDTKTIRELIKLRKMTPDQRREREALLDTYRAALGMLDGTPLGRWALERLEKKPHPKGPDEGAPAPGTDAGAPSEAPQDDPQPEPEPDVDEARRMGAAAARDGQPVTSNPFPARDVRRAAWDEAWCQALGSDGMEIPEALRPKKKSEGKGA